MFDDSMNNEFDKAADNKNIPELSQPKNFLGRWADFFINRYRITFLLIAIIVIWGVTRGFALQREAQPKVTIPYAIITTSYVGASPDEVERLISEPLEKELEELDDVNKIYSHSGFGFSSVTVEFESGVDMDQKIREVRDKVSNVDDTLPEDADTPDVTELKTGDSPVLVLSLSGEKEITILQEHAKKVKEAIEDVDGVRDVGLLGDVEREITIRIDPQKLSLYNLSLQDIKEAVGQSNVNFPGGDIRLNEKEYNVRTVGRFEDVSKIGNTIVKHTGDGQIFLKDIAVIEDGYKDVDIYSRRPVSDENGQNTVKEAVIISIKKKESADEIILRDKVVEMLEKKKGTLYPDDVKLEVISDSAKYVNEQLGSVTNNAISGLLLVIAVLFIFIGFRESLIVSTVIPISICFALGLMSAFGLTLNQITMFSLILAIGMLVDNAIVIMENIDRLRSFGLSAEVAAKVGTNQIAPAVVSSTLTTLAAFFPMILTSGIMGDFIRSIPLTVIFTLTASLIVALTITPSVSTRILKRYEGLERQKSSPVKGKIAKAASVVIVFLLTLNAFQDSGKTGISRYGLLSIVLAVAFSAIMFIKQFKRKGKTEEHFIIHRYSKFLEWIISRTWRKVTAILVTFVLLVASLGLIPAGILKVEMFGTEDFTTLYVSIKTPPGSNLDEMVDIERQIEQRLFKVKEIKSFVSYAGHDGADIWSSFEVESEGVPNKGRIIIELFEAENRDRTSMEVAAGLQKDLKTIAGAEIEVVELESGPPSGSAVELKIKGENMTHLEKTANDFMAVLKTINGVRNIDSSISELTPELRVKVDKEKAASLGLDDMMIATSLRNAINGLKATTFRNNQDEIDVTIRTSEEQLETVHDLEKTYFYNRMGNKIPFLQVAQVIESEGVMSISHEDGKRIIYVNADVNPDVTTGTEAINTFKEKTSNYAFPEGVVLEYGGESEAMGDSFGDMMINMIIAGVLVFIILAVQFNSLSQPAIILFTVPMALIGVVAGLVITGNNFGFLAFVGLVALVGIVVNNAIILVDYINYLRAAGYDMKDAIIKTGVTRLLPVFATTITTAGGILPITMTESFFEPLGVTLIFGLCVSTVLTLIIVPAVYSLLEGYKAKRKMKKERREELSTFLPTALH